jgi:RNA polymerase sigma-70 factor (ECF subfamily)
MQKVLSIPLTKTPVHSEEEAWIEAARDNPEAFAPLYNKYVQRIHNFIGSRVNDEELVHDLCSQVFIKAMTGLKNYRHQGYAFSSFLYRIAQNEISGYYRRNPNSRFVRMEEDGIDRLQAEVDNGMEWRDEVKFLYKMLGRLEQEDMEILQMRYFEEKSCAEIGEILNMQENSVRVKIFRVIRKLREFKG